MEAVDALYPENDTKTVDPERTTLTLFTLNGKRYSVPAKPKAVYTLRLLDRIRKHGMEVALAQTLPELIGEETWDELLQEEDLEAEHLNAILEALKKLLMGEVDASSLGVGR